MFLGDLIKKHWTVEHVKKDPKQLERERSMCLYLGGIKFNRWVLFLSAFMIQFCCGSLYSWSVFNAPIDKLIYDDARASKAVNAFYIAVALFGFTAMIMGPWLERNGPRRGVMLGSTVFLLGQAISSISLHYKAIEGVYIGYGVFCGFGLGLNYICPVSCLQKWFPDYRGVASGFAVGGFGAGSVVWSKVYLPLVARVGLPETFAIIGSMFFVLMLLCCILLRTPPPEFIEMMNAKISGIPLPLQKVIEDDKAQEMKAVGNDDDEGASSSKPDIEEAPQPQQIPAHAKPTVRTWTLIEAIGSADYWFLYLAFFGNELFGLVALSRLSNMTVELFGQTSDVGADVVAINGVFNCCGRLVFPMISDLALKWFSNNSKRFSPASARKGVFFVALTGQIVIVSILPQLIDSQNFDSFRAALWVLTALYGAGFGCIPAFLTNMYGPYNVGALHGIILTAWSIGGVGGGLGFTENYNHYKKTNIRTAYIYNFNWILAIICVGMVALFFVRTNPEERNKEGYYFALFGKKIFHIKPKKNNEVTSNTA